MNNVKYLKMAIWGILIVVIILILVLGSKPENNSGEIKGDDSLTAETAEMAEGEGDMAEEELAQGETDEQVADADDKAKTSKKDKKKDKKDKKKNKKKDKIDATSEEVAEEGNDATSEEATTETTSGIESPLSFEEAPYNYRFDKLRWDIKESDAGYLVRFWLDGFTRTGVIASLARPFAVNAVSATPCVDAPTVPSPAGLDAIKLGGLSCDGFSLVAVQYKNDPNTIEVFKYDGSEYTGVRVLKLNEILK